MNAAMDPEMWLFEAVSQLYSSGKAPLKGNLSGTPTMAIHNAKDI